MKEEALLVNIVVFMNSDYIDLLLGYIYFAKVCLEHKIGP